MKIFSIFLLMSFHGLLCAQDRLVQIDETQKLWVQQYGSGSPTIILINGGGDTIDTEWTGIIPKLSKLTSVLAYDRAGQVKSPGPSDIKTPRAAKDIVSQLRMLLSKLEIKPPYVLVAHSSGGLYAQYFARNYANDVKGLVMIDGNLPAEQLPERDTSLSPKMIKFINQYNHSHEQKLKAQYEKVLKRIHGTPTVKQNAQIAYSLEVMGKQKSVEQIIQSPPLSKDLVLAVLVSGKFPPEIAMQRHFSEEVPRSTFRIFPNAGHYIQKDRPGAVIKIIESVVKKVNGACSQHERKLDSALKERLKFMPDVAKWKWCHQKPILDPAREQQVLDKAIEQGAKYGLSKSIVQDVFQKQMDEAKSIQTKVTDELKTDPIDCALQTDEGLNQIRAQINQSTDKILQSLNALKEAECF